MNFFRIAREKYVRALTGEGARRFGGRWNFKGTPILYTSRSESLAALETLAHAPISVIPDDLSLLILSVSDDLQPNVLAPKDLPENWRNYPAPEKLAEMGARWIDSKSSLLLKVPSVLVQTEWNILINPAHSGMKKVKVKEVRPFTFDTRLFQ